MPSDAAADCAAWRRAPAALILSGTTEAVGTAGASMATWRAGYEDRCGDRQVSVGTRSAPAPPFPAARASAPHTAAAASWCAAAPLDAGAAHRRFAEAVCECAPRSVARDLLQGASVGRPAARAMPPIPKAAHLVGVVSALFALRRVKVCTWLRCAASSPQARDAACPTDAQRPEPPAHFCCSVTGELFEDPVIVTSTGARVRMCCVTSSQPLTALTPRMRTSLCPGHTYERAAIEAWFASHSPPTDPMTNLRCDATLVPNWCVQPAL